MDELIFKPVGMGRTTLRPFLAITYPFATGHALDAGKPTIIRPMFNNTAMWPAGSIFSNATDLSRWVIALLNGGKVEGRQLLSTSLVNQLKGHHVGVPGEKDAFYGYGLTIFKVKDLEFVAHGGFSRGYGSMIQMVPEKKFAVIVLTNKSGETMRQTLNKATEIGLGLKDDGQQQTETVAALTTAEMNDYAGTYSHAPQTWEVSIKDAKLVMKFDGKEYPMTKTGAKKFTFGAQNENEVVFVTGKSGKIDLIFTGLYGAKRITAGK
jgi:CubicO group peptidase (beta-lactamase class C family)